MSRAALIVFLTLGIWLLGLPARAQSGPDPHLSPSAVPGGCPACHRGHGASTSPMLPQPQVAVCLECHGSLADLEGQEKRGLVAPNVRPPSVGRDLSQAFTHPLTRRAFSRDERDAVTCTSCHSPHRGMQRRAAAVGGPAPSPRNPDRLEYELCQDCHGSKGATTQDPLDLSRMLSPNNRSFHPVEAPAIEASPSVMAELSGRQINCSDCHGNSDPAGARGPHGSPERFILGRSYRTLDGGKESPSTYALCYSCHERELVLQSRAFPEHARHVVDLRASCTTCHNPHGSVNRRALIRFGDGTPLSKVAPSASTGRLDFVSDQPSSGVCYLTCHGYDHAPAAYGVMETFVETDPELNPLGAGRLQGTADDGDGENGPRRNPGRQRPPRKRPRP